MTNERRATTTPAIWTRPDREAQALEPLRARLREIAALNDKRALVAWIGQDLRADVDPLNMTNFHTPRLFGVWIARTSTIRRGTFRTCCKAALGCRIAITTSRRAIAWNAIRSAYRAHIARVLELAGIGT